MSANNFTQAWSGPGIMQSFVNIKHHTGITEDTLEQWFDDVYVPNVLQTGIVKSASRWKAADTAYDKQWMILYEVDDLGLVQSGGLKKVPRTSTMFPTDGPVDNFIELESRVLSLEQNYGSAREIHCTDQVTTVIYANMQPAPGGEADLDAWYKDEHNQQMSEQPGWKGTTRYKLVYQTRNDGNEPSGSDFLALHYFGAGHKLGKNVEALQPVSDWTKRVMGECTAIDAANYRKVG